MHEYCSCDEVHYRWRGYPSALLPFAIVGSLHGGIGLIGFPGHYFRRGMAFGQP
jgi:hypothetical protein